MASSASLNFPPVLTPALGMRVNGTDQPGLLSFHVAQNNYRSGDTFSATIALDGTAKGYGAPFWALQDTVELELLASVDGTAPASLIIGLVDRVSISLEAQTLQVSGRDYSSVLIDTKTSEKFPNLTSSQIAEKLAARHSLPANITATSELAGTFYAADYVKLTDEVSEHDLLCYLADKEGFDYYFSGKTLTFAPPADNPPVVTVNYAYAGPAGGPVGNVVNLQLDRALTLARDIKVTVITWNHGHKKGYRVSKQSAKVKKSPGGGPSLPAHTYVFRVPGLTQDQAAQLAQKKLEEISKHERRIAAPNLPAIPALTPRYQVRVVGTQTDFDQTYYIDEIEHRFGFAQGATTRISALNSSPSNEVTL